MLSLLLLRRCPCSRVLSLCPTVPLTHSCCALLCSRQTASAMTLQPRSSASASSSSSASAAPMVSRLATRGTLQAAVCMPRGATSLAAFSGAHGSAQQHRSSLDANLHVIYATGRGDGSEVTLRSIMSDEQIERRKQMQRDAAEDENNSASALSGFDASSDPAPIVASHRLQGCEGVTRLACLSDRVAVASTGAGECSMIEIANGPEANPVIIGGNSSSGFASAAAQRRARAAAAASSSLHLRVAHTFPTLHASSATSLAVQLASSTPLIATCGEDGSLALLAPFTRQIVRHIPCAHPSALYTLCFGSVHTLHAAGMGGHISSWDLRESSAGGTAAGSNATPAKPSAVMVDPNAVSITSSCLHPTRPNVLAVGSSNGALSLFDLRATAVPICSIQAQRSAIWDLAFVPWAPSSLLAASEDGSICSFDFGAGFDGSAAAASSLGAADSSVFSSKAVEAGMKPSKIAQQACAVRSISMDRDTRTMIAGTDAPYLLTCTLPAGRL